LLASSILLGYMLIKNRKAFKFSLKQFLMICLLGLLGIYLTNIFEFYSLQHLSAAKSCFIYSLSPFFSCIFSYFHFGERLNLRKGIGMLIGFAGIIPVLAIQKESGELLSFFQYLSLPELAMIGASICTVYGWVLLRYILKDSSVTP